MSNYSIKTASRLSGVSELLIRAWEGRYDAITPGRSETNRRIYSDEDINKLIVLRKLTGRGHRIGNVAKLSFAELSKMLSKSEFDVIEANKKSEESDKEPKFQQILDDSIDSIRNYDSKNLEKILNSGFVEFSLPVFINNIILPLTELIGSYWRDGIFRVSHEHLASSVIRKLLGNISDGYNIPSSAPSIVITTPEGQYHEAGSLIGAAMASSDGWQVTYLGASLPAEDIAFVLKEKKSRCVFLSIVYPYDDPALSVQLRKLRQAAGDDVFIIISGNAAIGYKDTLNQINAHVAASPTQFREILQLVRNNINSNNGKK